MSRQRRGRLALSTVLGATFFVTVALLSMNVLVWQLAVYDSQLEDARLRDYSTNARFQEDAEITAMTIGSNLRLNATVRNEGNYLVHLVGVWITEYQSPFTATWHKRFSLNQRINPGRNVINVGQEISQTLTSTYTYVIKFVTAKGNVIVGVYSPITTFGKTGVSTTGYLFFRFNQDTFKMTNQTQGSPVPAWVISPGSQTFVWHVQVSNHGLFNATLFRFSALSFVQVSKSTSVTQTQFYIVSPTSVNASYIAAYQDLTQVIPANEQGDYNTGGTPQWVKFAQSKTGQLTFNWNPTTGSEYMIWMVFYYRYGSSEELTQIIPFVGVHVR